LNYVPTKRILSALLVSMAIILNSMAIGGIGTGSVDKDLLERRAGLEVVATHARIDQSGESIV